MEYAIAYRNFEGFIIDPAAIAKRNLI